MSRPVLTETRRVVVKSGTRVLTDDEGRIALSRLFGLVEAAAALARSGRQPLLVTSGAVGLGRDALGLGGQALELPDRQACAAVGQLRLMSLYEAGFSRLGMRCAQVLLTQGDFHDKRRYQSLQRALEALLARGVIPIINENDVVSTEELASGPEGRVFGDNDTLSALVASRLHAELLVLLTDVDGVYDRNPRRDPTARRLAVLGPEDEVAAGGSDSGAGRGGMASKVQAARMAARAGCHAVIASGRDPAALGRVLAGEDEGTWVPARGALKARKRWIAFAAVPRGRLVLDAGAVAALRDRGASLLAAGVRRAEGEFRRGDVVELLDEGGARVGRGEVQADLAATRRWSLGEVPPEARNRDALIPRELLVLEER